MADDWGLMENWDESGEGEPDTWWCEVCQADIPMDIQDGDEWPIYCPRCNTPFTVDGIVP